MSEEPGPAAQLYRDGFLVVKDGLRLHYRDYPGQEGKPPLVCLHGLTRNARDFASIAERYSPRWRVIALDFRGRGSSDYDPLPERYKAPTYAGDVLQLLDYLQVDEAVFVGTSLGGLVTMIIAATAPQRIAAAILNDIGPEIDPVGLARILSYVGNGRRFRSWGEAADALAAIHGSSFNRYTRDDWLRMARRNCREDNGEVRFDYDMAIAEPFKTTGPTPHFDLWPLFAALAQNPLLVIRGGKSDLLTAAAAAKMQQVAPQMKLATVEGAGHAPVLDEPEAVAAIDKFLSSLRA